MPDILIIEDKKSFGEMLKGNLEDAGLSVHVVHRGREAIKYITREQTDIVLIDLRLPDIDGVDLLKELRAINTDIAYIIMTAYGSIERAVEAMRLGAHDFITKPFDVEQLIQVIQRILHRKRCLFENILLKEETTRLHGYEIVGRSAAIKKAAELLKKAAPTDATVLLLGESGTGKELFARACHTLSTRIDYSFVPINCAAIPRELLENELFGSERGAFTGAATRKLGKFELANKGTIFLDEIGDLDLDLQAKILRVLQEKAFERLGGTVSINVDVRVIAASNKDLLDLVKQRMFREDLYYRLSVFPIRVPSLRERIDDIPLLIEHTLKRLGADNQVSDKALEKLVNYFWPGNIRELENTIERAVILADATIRPEHVLLPQHQNALFTLGSVKTLKQAAAQGKEVAEAALISRILADTNGNKSEAARRLEVSYKTLLTRITEYKKKNLL
ncbi:sigma-54-dependent Fis family transcriptional regulator [candidate division WOR-3 bacterium]|nr:sigma-54-dependent Fis family transcriptional regulator [candidate division WOR-3 bacterium]